MGRGPDAAARLDHRIAEKCVGPGDVVGDRYARGVANGACLAAAREIKGLPSARTTSQESKVRTRGIRPANPTRDARRYRYCFPDLALIAP